MSVNLREAIEAKMRVALESQAKLEAEKFRRERERSQFLEQMQNQLEASGIPDLFSQLQEYFQDPEVMKDFNLRCKPCLTTGSGAISVATLDGGDESSIKNELFIGAELLVGRVILSYGKGELGKWAACGGGIQSLKRERKIVEIPTDSPDLLNNVQSKIVELLLNKDRITWLGYTPRDPHDPYTRGDFDGGG